MGGSGLQEGVHDGTHPTALPGRVPRRAVRLARSPDRSVPQLARELGVSPHTLTNWIAQDRVDAGELPGLTTDERARLRELERENRILREERGILRKAAGFF